MQFKEEKGSKIHCGAQMSYNPSIPKGQILNSKKSGIINLATLDSTVVVLVHIQLKFLALQQIEIIVKVKTRKERVSHRERRVTMTTKSREKES